MKYGWPLATFAGSPQESRGPLGEECAGPSFLWQVNVTFVYAAELGASQQERALHLNVQVFGLFQANKSQKQTFMEVT